MKKFLILLIFLTSTIFAEEYNTKTIKKLIAKMVVLGFKGEDAKENTQIYKDIKAGLGGVILFSKDPNDKKKIKNIRNPEQLKKLTYELQAINKEKLIISIDQEGGVVQRLNRVNGFLYTPRAIQIARRFDTKFAKKSYENLSAMLKNSGINLNFAPVVDLAITNKNKVIVKLGRSYGKDVKTVNKYANIFIDAQDKNGIISVLKHFPGHGSSLADSHKGFVDISDTWTKKELEPYKYFIKNKKAKVIMTAHVYNKNLDAKYPATLSYKINTELLRDKLAYKGVIISDDLQMKAISSHYSLKQSLTLAINSGVNLLLFANQNAKEITLEKIVNTVYKQILSEKISLDKIIKSNQKIKDLLGN